MSDIGDFLRAHRGSVRPEDVGLTAGARRRVHGLRREEVAMLAGMSVDYYSRLEQGRELRPSASILIVIGDALRLDHDALQHSFRIAGLAPATNRLGTLDRSETIDPALAVMLEAWQEQPALVLGRAYDVLGGNPLGEALFSGFQTTRNLVEKVFLDPASRKFYVDWEHAARNTVAGLRLNSGEAPSHPRIRDVVAGLRRQSTDFTRMWDGHQARGKRIELKCFLHPVVGPLTLQMHAFDVRAAPGQELVIYQPTAESADAMAFLRVISGPADASVRA